MSIVHAAKTKPPLVGAMNNSAVNIEKDTHYPCCFAVVFFGSNPSLSLASQGADPPSSSTRRDGR